MFGNLLEQALTIIPKQTFTYCKQQSATANEYGNLVPVYDEGTEYEGSVQAVEQTMYDELGLDRSRKYIKIYSSLDIHNVSDSQDTPDKIIWDGKEYLVVDVESWYKQDGWTKIIAVEQKVEQQDDEEEQENDNNQSGL